MLSLRPFLRRRRSPGPPVLRHGVPVASVRTGLTGLVNPAVVVVVDAGIFTRLVITEAILTVAIDVDGIAVIRSARVVAAHREGPPQRAFCVLETVGGVYTCFCVHAANALAAASPVLTTAMNRMRVIRVRFGDAASRRAYVRAERAPAGGGVSGRLSRRGRGRERRYSSIVPSSGRLVSTTTMVCRIGLMAATITLVLRQHHGPAAGLACT
jgi:hypothetical protein